MTPIVTPGNLPNVGQLAEANLRAAKTWAARGAKLGAYGGAAGGTVGFFFAVATDARMGGDGMLFVGWGLCVGALLLAAIPVSVAAWMLLLHMIGQVSAAARNKD